MILGSLALLVVALGPGLAQQQVVRRRGGRLLELVQLVLLGDVHVLVEDQALEQEGVEDDPGQGEDVDDQAEGGVEAVEAPTRPRPHPSQRRSTPSPWRPWGRSSARSS